MPAPARLAALKHRIARLEAQGAAVRPGRGTVALGDQALDRALGGGLVRGSLHEIRAGEADGALAFGFALALVARIAEGDGAASRALIVTGLEGIGEWGRPYGPGLAGFGLDPARLLMVETRRPRETLWAAEEGLASRALAVVLAEIRGDPALVDLTATRRLALRAARGGVMALLVRPGAGEGLTAARTRWRVRPLAGAAGVDAAGAAPSVAGLPSVLPPPAWALDLERNAARPGGRFALTWRAERRLFAAAPPEAGPVAGTGEPYHSGPQDDDATLPHPQASPAGGRAAVLPLRRTG